MLLEFIYEIFYLQIGINPKDSYNFLNSPKLFVIEVSKYKIRKKVNTDVACLKQNFKQIGEIKMLKGSLGFLEFEI